MIVGRLAHAPFILLYAMYVVSSWYAVFQVNQWLQLPPVFKVIATIEAVSTLQCLLMYILLTLSYADENYHEKLLLHT